MKKINLFLIHGWGFDSSFWNPLINEMKIKYNFYSFKPIDLGFFKTQSKIRNIVNNKDNIFIVHSYGLNWLIKKNPKFNLIINFSGKPLFIESKDNKDIRKKILKKMISEFKMNPLEVLKKFYFNCGLKTSFLDIKKTKFSKEKLERSLEHLYDDNLIEKIKKIDSKIFSFFMSNDKISTIDNPNKLFPNYFHHCQTIRSDCHAFPLIQYKQTAKLINQIIKENIK